MPPGPKGDVGCQFATQSVQPAAFRFATNMIKRNDRAYQVYMAHRQQPRVSCLPEPGFRQIIENAPAEERHGLRSKISRLRRECKDSLVARVVSLESAAGKQRDIENRLREEILRLSDRK